MIQSNMKTNLIRSRYGRWTLLLALVTAIAGTGLSLHMRSRILQSEAAAARLTAEALRMHTEQELALFTEVLESVRALHALSDAVDQAAMTEFIEKGMIHQHTVLGAFGLAQRISPQLRTEIEAKEKNQPGAYNIVQPGPNGTWTPAETRPVYNPLTWQSRKGTLDIPVGFDFSANPANRRVIQHLEQTRKTALVPTPIALPGIPADSHWVFAPIMQRNVPNTVIGFAVAILRPETILKKITALSASAPELRLKALLPSSSPIPEGIRRSNTSWHYTHSINAIGTQWIFECNLPVRITGHRSSLTFLFGLILTSLMTSLLLILGGQTRKIEAQVNARTEELRIANTQLQEHLLERAHMEEEMNELAAREQRRIGRDLHDSLGQKLTGAVFLSRSLFNYLKESEGEQKTHAKTLNETLKSAVSQVRNMARGLASITLNDESLEESLEQLADEMSGLYTVSCTSTCQGKRPALDRKTKEQLYFIAREAVNNAARHAQASHITIQLTGDPSGWILRIKDNGKGFSGEKQTRPNNEGLGLRTMRYRAGRIGAEFRIDSTPNQGTRIEITGTV